LTLCHRLGRNALGVSVVVLLFLSLQALAGSPLLHHALHHDSHQPDHQCVVKLLSDGQLDLEPVLFCVIPKEELLSAPSAPESHFPRSSRHLFPPGRGPPSLIS
jgi:hypothetical protein